MSCAIPPAYSSRHNSTQFNTIHPTAATSSVLSADSRRFHPPPSSSSSSPIVRTQFLYSLRRLLSLSLSLLISLSHTHAHSLTSSQLFRSKQIRASYRRKLVLNKNEVGSETRVPASNEVKVSHLQLPQPSAHSQALVTIPPPCVGLVSLHRVGSKLTLPSFLLLFAGNV